MLMKTERIGPEEAKELLSKLMPKYRAPNPRFVRQMADRMRRGEWQPSGDSIKRDDEAGLVDGRMRLLAVVESGCTVDFVVMRGKFELFEPPEEN